MVICFLLYKKKINKRIISTVVLNIIYYHFVQFNKFILKLHEINDIIKQIRGQQMFSEMGQIVNIINSGSYASRYHNYSTLPCRAKVATHNMETNRCSWILIKLHFQKQKTGLIWPKDHSWPIHGPRLLTRLQMMQWLNTIWCPYISARKQQAEHLFNKELMVHSLIRCIFS